MSSSNKLAWALTCAALIGLPAGACGKGTGDGNVMFVEHPPPEKPEQTGSGAAEDKGSPQQSTPSSEPEPDGNTRDDDIDPGEHDAPSDARDSDGSDSESERGTSNLAVGDDPCTADSDCVPASCCHASACVAKGNAPDCSGVMCTQECRYGTTDCGGGCVCHQGRCAARLSEPPGNLQQ